MDAPVEHLKDAQKLEADAYVHLFKIALRPSGFLYLKADDTKTWQGNEWEGTAIKISGVGNSADEQTMRPKLQIVNPDGIFSALIDQGKLNRAVVTRIRVLRAHFDANVNISHQQTWIVMRVATLTHDFVLLELRDTIDGPNFLCPARMFTPPEFPMVSLR